MQPILILQHLSADDPAYLATWLERHGIAYELRNAESGDPYPTRIEGFAALAVLGGEMSANDPLPSLRRAEALILDAMANGRPVIGHCLGGQLMARALGERVVRSPAPEIGWQPMTVLDHAEAQRWLGDAGQRRVYHWHEEAFELPAGAVALAGSAACTHQAFAIGPHLAMQFHIEIDEPKLRRWAESDTPAYRDAQRRHASVQSGARMCAELPLHLPAHQALADRIYARWWRGVLASG
jgi:GMP synthase-like glutamine amidotransferase